MLRLTELFEFPLYEGETVLALLEPERDGWVTTCLGVVLFPELLLPEFIYRAFWLDSVGILLLLYEGLVLIRGLL